MLKAATAATMMMAAGVAYADAPPPFMGSWAWEASCPAHDIITYGPSTVESAFAHCIYDGYSEVAPDHWRVEAQCRYEGEAAPVTFDLHIDGNRLREITTTEDGNQQEIELVRCVDAIS